jgi:hypothetical protein
VCALHIVCWKLLGNTGWHLGQRRPQQMSRSKGLVVVVALAIGCLSLLAGSAYAQPAADTVEQARGAFARAGYQVDAAHTWDWMAPSFSSFQVRDTANDRVLMVLVYPSADAAQAARLEAAAHEQMLNVESPERDAAPRLVTGYGPSTWIGNVALVETTGYQLDRIYKAQVDRDAGLYVDPQLMQSPIGADVAVDPDFQQALQRGAVVNL